MRWPSRIRCPGAEAPDNKTELKLRTPRHRVRCGNAPNLSNQLLGTAPESAVIRNPRVFAFNTIVNLPKKQGSDRDQHNKCSDLENFRGYILDSGLFGIQRPDLCGRYHMRCGYLKAL
jgi:hypothetical protein